MTFLKRLTDLFVFGNIYVAIPVTCLAWESYLLVDQSPSPLLLAFVYAATLLLYSVHRFVGVTAMRVGVASARHEWAQRNKVVLAGIIGLSTGASLILFVQLGSPITVPLLAAAAMAGLYALPIIPGKAGFQRLRDLPGIKIYFIVAAVTLVTLHWPLSGVSLSATDWVLFTLERALFLLAITIPFDVRDLQADAGAKLNTIPLRIGESQSVRLSLLLIGLFAALVGLHYALSPEVDSAELLALEFSALITGVILLQVKSTRSEYFFSLLVEGTMVVQFALVWLMR